jgi:hypothetical protein
LKPWKNPSVINLAQNPGLKLKSFIYPQIQIQTLKEIEEISVKQVDDMGKCQPL